MSNHHRKFHQNHQFCPKCKTTLGQSGNMVSCPNKDCGFTDYHNPTPAACAVVVQDNKVLLALRALEPEKGKWDAPGGFVDIGESIEETITRELKEETNLNVTEVMYLGSIPDIYGERQLINLAYLVRVAPGKPIPMDDVSDLKWFDLDSIPSKEELAFKNTWEAIELYKKYLANKKEK